MFEGLLGKGLEVIDVEEGDAEHVTDAGIDVAGNGNVHDEHRLLVAPFHDRLDVTPFEQDAIGGRGGEQHVGDRERIGELVEGDGPAVDATPSPAPVPWPGCGWLR